MDIWDRDQVFFRDMYYNTYGRKGLRLAPSKFVGIMDIPNLQFGAVVGYRLCKFHPAI